MEEERIARIARVVVDHLGREQERAAADGVVDVARLPPVEHVEMMLDVGFWASLRREEGRSPRISMAYLSPAESSLPLRFQKRLSLTSEGLTRLAPAVERPGIHLGVWDDGEGLHVWGACRDVPALCLVLEVVEPGLLVVKHQRSEGLGKFANLAVLQGEQVRVVSGGHLQMLSEKAADVLEHWREEANGVTGNDLLVQVGASMRAHGKGGTLLIVPAGSDTWRESIVRPISYAVDPPFNRLRQLLGEDPDESDRYSWAEMLRQTIASVAGLTAVDGATVMSTALEILAFGAKIGRRAGRSEVEELLLMEPVVDAEPERWHPLQIGGTRHLSAAQFVHDQHDALALVASQDGRFTAFSWLEDRQIVGANRVEVLLL